MQAIINVTAEEFRDVPVLQIDMYRSVRHVKKPHNTSRATTVMANWPITVK